MRHQERIEIKAALREAIKPVGLLPIAAELGVVAGTLDAEISNVGLREEDAHGRNKLGLVHALEILELADNPWPVLRLLARKFLLHPGTAAPLAGAAAGEPVHAIMTRVAERIGLVATRVREGADPSGERGAWWSPAELATLHAEIDEARAALALLELAAEEQAARPIPIRGRRG